jgi:hypothetical protein
LAVAVLQDPAVVLAECKAALVPIQYFQLLHQTAAVVAELQKLIATA